MKNEKITTNDVKIGGNYHVSEEITNIDVKNAKNLKGLGEIEEEKTMKKIFEFGKIDFNGTGRKVNLVEVEITLENGIFTAHGAVWNSRHTDWICGGQCLDTLRKYFRHNKLFNRIWVYWKTYHLNDMHAGTKAQENALELLGITGSNYDYDKACKVLEDIGLYKIDGYLYGHGWLKQDIDEIDLKGIKALFNE